MKININNTVKVRLNDLGRKIINEHNDKIKLRYPIFKGSLIETDDKGWSTWQLWELMAIFGPYISLGKDSPIGYEIEIENVDKL